LKELADYYARLVSWYTQGRLRRRARREARLRHHFKIDYWEIFNEIEGEHDTTPEQYTARYDAIAAAIHKVAPHMKFVALALMSPPTTRITSILPQPEKSQAGHSAGHDQLPLLRRAAADETMTSRSAPTSRRRRFPE